MSATDRIKQSLEGFIQEMLHGIFHTFTRYYDYGYQKINLFGHNVYWQAVVYVIEKAEGRGSNLLGLNLRWDRENDMACDVNKGHTLPNNAMLRSLGLDISDIWDRMKSHRFRRDRERKKRAIVHLPSNRCIKNGWILDF
jgi:hypothetical protein